MREGGWVKKSLWEAEKIRIILAFIKKGGRRKFKGVGKLDGKRIPRT